MAEEYTPRDFTEDKLRFRAEIPTPMAQEVLAKRFEANAIVGKQGITKTVLIHDGDSDATAYVTKTPLSKWAMHINNGKGGENAEDYKDTLSRINSIEGAKAAAAEHLAAVVTDVGDLLAEAKRHRLSEYEVLEVDVGQTDRRIHFNDSSGGKVSFEAEIPMPEEFQVIYDRFIDSVRMREEAGIITVGDDVSGFIRAERKNNGSWTALGQGDVGYSRKFSAGTDTNDIVYQLAEDMASLEMSDDTILNHIRRHGVSEDDILSIEMGGRSYDLTDPEQPHDALTQ